MSRLYQHHTLVILALMVLVALYIGALPILGIMINP